MILSLCFRLSLLSTKFLFIYPSTTQSISLLYCWNEDYLVVRKEEPVSLGLRLCALYWRAVRRLALLRLVRRDSTDVNVQMFSRDVNNRFNILSAVQIDRSFKDFSNSIEHFRPHLHWIQKDHSIFAAYRLSVVEAVLVHISFGSRWKDLWTS